MTSEDGTIDATGRTQVVAPGYTLGLGVEYGRPEWRGRSIDAGMLVHHFRPFNFGRPETWWELSVGLTI